MEPHVPLNAEHGPDSSHSAQYPFSTQLPVSNRESLSPSDNGNGSIIPEKYLAIVTKSVSVIWPIVPFSILHRSSLKIVLNNVLKISRRLLGI